MISGGAIMVGILIVSHGPLAQGLLDSYRFFNDDTTQIEAHCLKAEEDPKAFYQVMDEACERLDTKDGVLILTDIPGGTPANQAQLLLQKRKLAIIAGANVLMLIEAAISRNFMDLETLCDHCLLKGQESVIKLGLNESISDDSDVEF